MAAEIKRGPRSIQAGPVALKCTIIKRVLLHPGHNNSTVLQAQSLSKSLAVMGLSVPPPETGQERGGGEVGHGKLRTKLWSFLIPILSPALSYAGCTK